MEQILGYTSVELSKQEAELYSLYKALDLVSEHVTNAGAKKILEMLSSKIYSVKYDLHELGEKIEEALSEQETIDDIPVGEGSNG